MDVGPLSGVFNRAADDVSPAPGAFLIAAASCLVDAGVAGSDATVIVPDSRLVTPLKRALFGRAAQAGRAWLPPVVETLDALAAAHRPIARVRGREARLLALAAALADDGRAGWSGRLQRAGELLDPIDAIARTLACDWLAAGAPGEPPVWTESVVLDRVARLAESAGAGLFQVLGGEWRTMARLGQVVATPDDPVQVASRQWQALRLAWLQRAPRLARVGWWPLAVDPAAPITGEPGSDVLRAMLAGLPDVRVTDCHPDRATLAGGATADAVCGPPGIFGRAWPEVRSGSPAAPVAAPIRERRLDAGEATVEGMILHALDREDESMRAADWIHRVLADGARSVAIVVLDRWLARRTRALLERADVLIDDREGWALSTTVAATWPMAWLDLCAFDPVDGALPVHGTAWIALASLLDSAFTRHPDSRRFAAMLRRRALGDAVTESPALVALERALIELMREQRAGRSARDQGLTLRKAMAALGADRTLPGDEAGRQVLAMIDRLGSPLEQVRRRCDHDAFRALLGFFLERQRFHDSAIRSPVMMTGLDVAALHAFDAVLVLGANAGQLPSANPVAPGLIDALLPGLGLVSAQVSAHDQMVALTCLLAGSPRRALTCRSDPGDGTLPSAAVVRLAAVAGLDLKAVGASGALARRAVPPSAARGDAFPMGRPGVSATLPESVSVSAIDRLALCPFRFLVNDVWRLGEPRDREEEPGKRELGIVVHEVLARFHREIDDPTRFDDDRLVERLARHTAAVLVEQPMLHAARLVQLREWRALQPEYVRAFRADHAEGWRFEAGEQRVGMAVALAGDRSLQIVGKFDRLDRRVTSLAGESAAGESAAGDAVRRVIDYKLRSSTQVGKLAADPDSAAQLLLYAWFTGADEAAYVAIERKAVKPRPLVPPPVESLPAWRARLLTVLDRVNDGEPLRALGDDCEYCDARGVCRQGHWRDDPGELATGQVADAFGPDRPGAGGQPAVRR